MKKEITKILLNDCTLLTKKDYYYYDEVSCLSSIEIYIIIFKTVFFLYLRSNSLDASDVLFSLLYMEVLERYYTLMYFGFI